MVFRNMNGTTNSFSTTCSDANAANKTVNMEDVDANNKAGKSTSAGGNYFYRNPYVGRVLDGYVCAEACTVDNTDKNYTIPTLTKGTNDLQVSENNGALNATVTSAQGLWLLSAIVNSGAGAMDATGSYTDVDNVVDAYSVCKSAVPHPMKASEMKQRQKKNLQMKRTGVELRAQLEVRMRRTGCLIW